MSSAALRLDTIKLEPIAPSTEAGVFGALASVLVRQIHSARALHTALRRKQDVLVKNRIGELQESAERAIGLAIELAQLEAQRLEELERLSAEGHLPSDPPEQLKAEHLLTLVPDSERRGLEQSCRELAEELDGLAETNLQNDLLMHNLVEYTNTVMRLLTRQDNAPTYGRQGSVLNGPAGRALLDSRV